MTFRIQPLASHCSQQNDAEGESCCPAPFLVLQRKLLMAIVLHLSSSAAPFFDAAWTTIPTGLIALSDDNCVACFGSLKKPNSAHYALCLMPYALQRSCGLIRVSLCQEQKVHPQWTQVYWLVQKVLA